MKKCLTASTHASVLVGVAPTPTDARLEDDSPAPLHDFPDALLRPIFIPNVRSEAYRTIKTATHAPRLVLAGGPSIDAAPEIPQGKILSSRIPLSYMVTGKLWQREVFYTPRMERQSP